MVSLKYKAARALCDQHVKDGLFRVICSGPICKTAFCLFQDEVIHRAESASAIIGDMGNAVLLMDEPPDVTSETFGNMAPAAVIVRREELWFWSDYARRCADVGVTVTVFLLEQRDLAVRWAEALARQAV